MTDASKLVTQTLEAYQDNHDAGDMELTVTVRVLGAEYDQSRGGLLVKFGLVPPDALTGFEELLVPLAKVKSLEAANDITSLGDGA